MSGTQKPAALFVRWSDIMKREFNLLIFPGKAKLFGVCVIFASVPELTFEHNNCFTIYEDFFAK